MRRLRPVEGATTPLLRKSTTTGRREAVEAWWIRLEATQKGGSSGECAAAYALSGTFSGVLSLADLKRFPVGLCELVADDSRFSLTLLIVGHAGEGSIYGGALGASRLIVRLHVGRMTPCSSSYQLV